MLPSQIIIPPDHLFDNITVPYLCSNDTPSRALESPVQSHIAHDGGHHRSLFQLLFGQHLETADGEDVVAIDLFSFPINEDDPVSIPVEGDSDVRPFVEDEASNHLRMQGTAIRIDVLSVGFDPDGYDLRS